MSTLRWLRFAISFLICISLLNAGEQDETNGGDYNPRFTLQLYELAAFEQWTSSPSSGISGGLATIASSHDAGRLRYSLLYSAVYSRQDSYSRALAPPPAFSRRTAAVSGSELNNIDHFLFLKGEYSLTPAAKSIETSRSLLMLNINAGILGINDSAPPVPAPDEQQFQRSTAPLIDRLNPISSPVLLQTLPLLFGSRVLAVTAETAIDYRKSPRLTLGLSLDDNRIQSISGARANSQPQFTSTKPLVDIMGAGVQASYLVSQRTQVGLLLSDHEMLSGYGRGRATGFSASVARRFSEFLGGDIHGGASYVSNRNVGGVLIPGSLQSTYGAGLRYQTRIHDFAISLDRNALDSYGTGANSTIGVTGTWQYHGLGPRASLRVEAGWQRLESPLSPPLQALQCSTTVTRRLSSQILIELKYLFARVISSPASAVSGNVQQIRLTASWQPTNLRIF